MKTTYSYAVIDCNQAPDQYTFAVSCHKSELAAIKMAENLNQDNPNRNYRPIHWDATRWARLRPNDSFPTAIDGWRKNETQSD